MLPGTIGCRHLQVDWLDASHCYCRSCGKVGHWKEEMVIWQRRPGLAAELRRNAESTVSAETAQTMISNDAHGMLKSAG